MEIPKKDDTTFYAILAAIGVFIVAVCVNFIIEAFQSGNYIGMIVPGAIGLVISFFLLVWLILLPQPYGDLAGTAMFFVGLFLLYGIVIALLLWAVTFISPAVSFSWIFIAIVSGVGTVITGIVLRLKDEL